MTQSTINFDAPHNSTATSRAAAADQSPAKSASDRQIILEYLREQTEHGGTRWEIAKATGVLYQTVCARVNSMVKRGTIIETERQRKTGNGSLAFVLVAPIAEAP